MPTGRNKKEMTRGRNGRRRSACWYFVAAVLTFFVVSEGLLNDIRSLFRSYVNPISFEVGFLEEESVTVDELNWWRPYLQSSNSTLRPWIEPQSPNAWCTRSHFRNMEIPVKQNTDWDTAVFSGLLYVAVPKCSSSTSQGINIRMARKTGRRIWTNRDCEHHNSAYYLNRKAFSNRNVGKSFLWSMVRDPRQRDLSQVSFDDGRYGR